VSTGDVPDAGVGPGFGTSAIRVRGIGGTLYSSPFSVTNQAPH
jgi:hypothetical protein